MYNMIFENACFAVFVLKVGKSLVKYLFLTSTFAKSCSIVDRTTYGIMSKSI